MEFSHAGFCRKRQKWLSEVMSSEGFTGQDRMMTMYGGMDSKSREAIKAAFQAAPDQSPVRILLATDAASEGIDLQNHCSKLIHYEIPWNPNRMEQRNGRIDRHGQKADHVQVFHFVSKGYKQRQSSPSAERTRSRSGVPHAGGAEGRDDPGGSRQRRAGARR